MFTTILGFFSNLFASIGKVTDYFSKKNTENLIKNTYEKDKEIDALEETLKTEELIDASDDKIEEIEEIMNDISNVNMVDAALTDEQVASELDSITDIDEQNKRYNLIKMAKEIKVKSDKTQSEIENDKKFNDGEEFTFKG